MANGGEVVGCPYCGGSLVGEGSKRLCTSCARAFYICLRCGEVFATPQALASHVRRHLRAENPPTAVILQRLQALEQRVAELERRLELLERRAAAPSPQVQSFDWLQGNPWLRVISERGEDR